MGEIKTKNRAFLSPKCPLASFGSLPFIQNDQNSCQTSFIPLNGTHITATSIATVSMTTLSLMGLIGTLSIKTLNI